MLLLLSTAALAACGSERRSAAFGPALAEMLSPDSLRQANHGRIPLRPDGYFAIPAGVTRVWVDVGAHLLETTLPAMQKNADLVLIAVEPLSEAWKAWPDSERIIGIPAALDLERGTRDFHVNRLNDTSSLLPSDPKVSVLPATDFADQTVEVRKVPVLTLRDVLERIPPQVDIEFLKTDVQGVDLQVLKSAGDQLRRAWRVKTEVIVHNEGVYLPEGEDKPGSEDEFTDYMKSMGFEFVRDRNIAPQRMWLDKEYVNADLASRDPRVRRPDPDVEWSLGK
jgi:FkbM family methyltransferase